MNASEKTPAVSVILPTFNRARLIGRAIRSVLDQTYRDFEMIIVDDGSTDDTMAVVKSFPDERIRYIKHETNKGGGTARNTGVKAAGGEYIAFQDSDDEWLPEKLEKQMKVFESAPVEVGVVYTDMLQISASGKTGYWHSPRIISGIMINPRTADYQVEKLGIQSTVIRRECFDKTGLFDENLPRLIDLELLNRMSKHYTFRHIREPLVKFYITAGISSNTGSLVTAQNLLIERYSVEVKNNRRFLARQYYRAGTTLCRDNQIGKGKAYLLKAVGKHPVNVKYLGAALACLPGQSTYNMADRSFQKIKVLFKIDA